MQRILLIAGLFLILVGFAWPWLSKIPLGRLPGDIHVAHDGFNFYFPVATCILISLVLSIVLWIFRR